MHICPICNGIIEYIKYCPVCGEKMEIKDRIENYYDDYSPYLSYEITDINDGNDEKTCEHFALCKLCGYRAKVYVSNIIE